MKKLILVALSCLVVLALMHNAFSAPINLDTYTDRTNVYADPDTITADSIYSDTLRTLRIETILCEVSVDSMADSLVGALLGSNDNINYTNCSDVGYSTITTAGNYGFLFTRAESFQYYVFHVKTHYGTGTLQLRLRWRGAKRY